MKTTETNPMNKKLVPSDNWPLKPRGQAPLDWVNTQTAKIKISNGTGSSSVHAVHDRRSWEGV